MKTTLRNRLLLLLAALLVLPLLLLIFSFCLPPQYEDTFLGEMPAKFDLLRTVPDKRIIVIGGSSVPFSLRSEQLEEALPGYRVVDFGLYADIGTVALLDWALPWLHEGDLVILSPELEQQTLSCYVGGESVLQACDGAYSQLFYLRSSRWGAVLAALPSFAGKKLHYTIAGAPEISGIYAKASFDRFGDLTLSNRSSNILPDGFQSVFPITLDSSLPGEDFISEIHRFSDLARKKGATVLWHFPPMNLSALKSADIDAYYDSLSEKLGIPILGDPHRSLLESGWFYDSNYHLNSSGAVYYTDLLIDDLKVWLMDTSPVPQHTVEMPPLSLPHFFGDDSCDAYFLYERHEDGWYISGLTEEGIAQTCLILPSRHENNPVIGVEEGALHNCPQLEQVTVQANIRTLQNGLFSGCTALRQVILTGTPQDYTLGDGFRDGASFLILVSESNLDSFRRSYFWQIYEPWLQAY